MRMLVVGGAGFIGSHLVEALLARGDEIKVIDSFASGTTKLDGVEYFRVDMSNQTSAASTASLFEASDYVFNLCGYVGVKRCYDHPQRSFRHNVMASKNIVSQAVYAEVPMLEVSSSSVYGKIEKRSVKENDMLLFGDPGNKSWQYGLHKAVAEADARNRGAVAARLFNVIGTRQRGDYGFVVPTFIAQIMRGQSVTIYGNGTQTRSFCDVRDLVAGLILLSEKGKPGEVYNLGSTREITISDLSHRVSKVLDRPFSFEYLITGKDLPVDYEETNQRLPCIDKVSLLGYEPQYDLDDTIEWIASSEYGWVR